MTPFANCAKFRDSNLTPEKSFSLSVPSWQVSSLMHKVGIIMLLHKVGLTWVTPNQREWWQRGYNVSHRDSQWHAISLSPLSPSHAANKSISTMLECAAIFCCHRHFKSPVNISLPPSLSFSPAGLGCHICSTSIISTCSCHTAWHFIPNMGQAGTGCNWNSEQ